MILSLNPLAGISGDMLLGALLDVGAPLESVRRAIASTGLTGWSLDVERVDRGGVLACRAAISVHPGPPSRPAAELIDMAGRAEPAHVRDQAVGCLRILAQVEARIHGVSVDDVHLHELGGDDTLIDVVGVAAAVGALHVQSVYSAPIAIGSGVVGPAGHGLLPVPAPATAALLEGAWTVGLDIRAETVTPTGAALLRMLDTSYRPHPVMSVVKTGYGAGTRQLNDRPNIIQCVLGEALGETAAMVVLETNVDDVTGEDLGTLFPLLEEAGARDVWITPATMKKGRPGHVVHVLADPETAPGLERRILALTGSLGLRRSMVERPALPRSEVTVDVLGQSVRVKRGPWTLKPEHDDVVRAARLLDLPLGAVKALASQAAATPPVRVGDGVAPDVGPGASPSSW